MNIAKPHYQAIVGRALTNEIYAGLPTPVIDDFMYGAIEIDPGLLTLQCMFADDQALEDARSNNTCTIIKERVIEALRREGYPEQALPHVHVGFASLTEVNLQGGPWYYFH